MLDETAAALARAFVANPLHVAAFGPGRLDRNRAFFRIGLGLMGGTKLVLFDDVHVRGFVHWIDAPSCRTAPWSKLVTLPRLAAAVGPGAAWRVVTWLTEWERHDPSAPHVHLGPIGVDPAAQRRGLGQVLMRHYCERLDRDRVTGYLETDRPENVRFYERFGFQTEKEIDVLGVRNFLMRRG